MKRLTLLRHAKSSWDNSELKDRDRPLNERGLRDAPMMGERSAKVLPSPDLVLTSPAVRTRQTVALFLEGWGLSNTTVEEIDEFYLADQETLREIIAARINDVSHILVCAHQPGIGEFIHWLQNDCPRDVPTCALFSFRVGPSGVGSGEVFLDFEDRPKRRHSAH